MTERTCSICNPVAKKLKEKNKHLGKKESTRIVVDSLEAFGSSIGCGDDRITCLPLIRANEEYVEARNNK